MRSPPVDAAATSSPRTAAYVSEHAPAPVSGGGVAAAWLLSLALHAGALGIMLLVVFPFAAPPDQLELPQVYAQIIGDVDTPLTAAVQQAQTQPATETPDPDRTRFAPQTPPAAEAVQRLSPAHSPAPSDLSVIGLGPGGPGADNSGLTLDAGGGAEFFGVGGSAPGVRKIVYVVDRSGSMVDTFRHVQVELKRSVSALRRSQKFHVIFFNAAEPLESPPLRLVNAIEAHKSDFFRFLESVTPQGGTKPERALRRALALEPDILYLLSDGINFDPALLQKLNEWNPDRRTRIFTIAYLDQTGRQILEGIAREHRGEYKFVSEDDLP